MPEDFQIRFAQAGDAEVIHQMICELAVYEKEPDAVVCEPDDLRRQLAQDRPPFECLLLERDGREEGFALFFHNYSTWRGRAGLFLEDLFVREPARGRGGGKALLRRLAAIAVERGCPRFEWMVLDWNQPAIAFYRSLGAESLDGWTTFRVSGEALAQLAASDCAADDPNRDPPASARRVCAPR
ncbi:MAG: GNAT family N-acetyltransferase [Myxococcales bacterium FL481]|nr:MAG: GNAT family N-acetyltransferase [Myxococcales bacterium FL481]